MIFLVAMLVNLPELQNNKRLLLLFANENSNALFIKQKQILDANQAGLTERDLIVKTYFKAEQPELFTSKHIKEPFTVILVGKDGDEKLRQHDVLSIKKLFATIDAMPMRRQEMDGKQ